jgi:ankyrin repeat protein
MGNGAQVNQTDANGAHALLLAVAQGKPEAVRLLLDHGADVNVKTMRGLTSLMAAEASGNTELTLLLTSAGATE